MSAKGLDCNAWRRRPLADIHNLHDAACFVGCGLAILLIGWMVLDREGFAAWLVSVLAPIGGFIVGWLA